MSADGLTGSPPGEARRTGWLLHTPAAERGDDQHKDLTVQVKEYTQTRRHPDAKFRHKCTETAVRGPLKELIMM